MRLTPSLAIVGSLQFGLSGSMDGHVYALRGAKGIVLIDSGAGTHTAELLANVVSEFGSSAIEAVIVTHCHLDHCGGAAGLQNRTGCRVIASEPGRSILETGDEEASGLRAARLQGTYPPDLCLAPCAVDLAVRDGQSFEAGGFSFTGIHVRGHSRDSFCYLTTVDGVLSIFTGDAVFYGGVLGVINVEGSGMEGYRADLGKLGGLQVEGLFPGHGLFTLRGGQRHLDQAIAQATKGFMPRQVGQGDSIF
jgi:hydroxyacylglutathione hydrolase